MPVPEMRAQKAADLKSVRRGKVFACSSAESVRAEIFTHNEIQSPLSRGSVFIAPNHSSFTILPAFLFVNQIITKILNLLHNHLSRMDLRNRAGYCKIKVRE